MTSYSDPMRTSRYPKVPNVTQTVNNSGLKVTHNYLKVTYNYPRVNL